MRWITFALQSHCSGHKRMGTAGHAVGASYADIILDELDFKQAQIEKNDIGREKWAGVWPQQLGREVTNRTSVGGDLR